MKRTSYPLNEEWFPGTFHVCDYVVAPNEFRNGQTRVYKINDWPSSMPQPWITNVVPLMANSESFNLPSWVLSSSYFSIFLLLLISLFISMQMELKRI